MDKKDIYIHEQNSLRSELQSLKNCQITFLSTSITATGILLGLETTLVDQFPSLKIISLFPLIVLFPSWWIFFDKATTITRIVGYYRYLEKLINEEEKEMSELYIGWENGLREFRANSKIKINDKSKEKKNWLKNYFDILFLRTTHKYWVITYNTFLSLSGICIVFSLIYRGFSESIKKFGYFFTFFCDYYSYLIYFVLFIFFLSIGTNFRIMWQLIYGRKSYNINENIWIEILNNYKKTRK